MIGVRHMKRKLARTLFIVIYALFLLFAMNNFYLKGIKQCGFYNSDEGYYVQSVKTYFYAFKYFKNTILGSKDLGSLRDYLMVYGGPYFHSARQGYIFITAALSSSFLKDYYFYHGLQWSVFFGILSIYLVYLFSFRNFGVISAVISASLFTFSSIHLAFARSVHTVTMSIFFLLLGIIFYFQSYEKIKFLKWSALCFGFGFSCHYNLFWIFPVVMMSEIYELVSKKKKDLLRMKTTIVFSAIPIICIELFTLLVRLILQNQQYFGQIAATGTPGYLDYFSDLLLQFTLVKNYSEIGNNSFFSYFNLITEQHSLIFVVLTILGLLLTINKFLKTKDSRMLFLGLLFLPFLFYSAISNKADKMIVSFIPVFCIYIGIIPSFLKNKAKYLLIITLVYIVFYQFDMSTRCLKYQMDISEALMYMRQGKGIKHLSSRMYISQAYVGKQNATDDFFYLGPEPGESGKSIIRLKNLENFYENGFHYYLCYYDDKHKLADIARQLKPEISYYRYYNIEGHYGRIPNRGTDSVRKAIEIYDVKKIIDYLKHSLGSKPDLLNHG